MGLSTQSLPEGGTGLSKTIGPGNYTVKVNKIELEDFRFIEGAKHLIIHVETEPLENFEGFLIDKNDPSKGHYKGQVGRVKASQYAYADGETKTGIKVQRDVSILVFLRNLCKALKIEAWFEAQDGKHDTIEDFVDAFNNTASVQDVYIEMCIAGKEYTNKQGYPSYDLYLAKSIKGAYNMAPKGSSRIMTYNEAEHLKKADITPVSKFDTDEDDLSMPTASAADFDLD